MIRTAKAVIRHNGKYLMLKRAPQCNMLPKHWDFPGGKIDPGETAEEAVIREVKEETNLDVTKATRVFQFETEVNNKQHDNTIFEIETSSFDITLSLDHTAFKWMSHEEILAGDTMPFVLQYFESV